MATVPVNIRVAKAIINAGYAVGDQDNSAPGIQNVSDSPCYYIYRRPVAADCELDFWQKLFGHTFRQDPIWVGTLYFQPIPEIHESRFAKESWAIVVEEEIYAGDMENLAADLTTRFNPTKVFIRRIKV